jgi:hypothetical protein
MSRKKETDVKSTGSDRFFRYPKLVSLVMITYISLRTQHGFVWFVCSLVIVSGFLRESFVIIH